MGQKTHPLGFRLGITQTHRSSWFATTKNYPNTLEEDFKIRTYLEKELRLGQLYNSNTLSITKIVNVNSFI